MLPIGMLLGLGAYGTLTYGWILVHGYNITPRQWFSPLNPYQGAISSAGKVPSGSVFPTAKSKSNG